MPYKIKCDSSANQGLQVWLTAMREVAMDYKVKGYHDVFTGAPVRVDPIYSEIPEVTFVSVDIHGRPVEGGMLRIVRVDEITEIAVW